MRNSIATIIVGLMLTTPAVAGGLDTPWPDPIVVPQERPYFPPKRKRTRLEDYCQQGLRGNYSWCDNEDRPEREQPEPQRPEPQPEPQKPEPEREQPKPEPEKPVTEKPEPEPEKPSKNKDC